MIQFNAQLNKSRSWCMGHAPMVEVKKQLCDVIVVLGLACMKMLLPVQSCKFYV